MSRVLRVIALVAIAALLVPVPSASGLSESIADLDFYGVEFVPPAQFDDVAALGANAVLIDFPASKGPNRWKQILDAADDEGLRVVATLYPFQWEWDESVERWRVSKKGRKFLRTIEDHPALLAVYALHEPYWNGCEGCGYTTAQQQALYDKITGIADVDVYSSFSSFKWAHRTLGPKYEFAPGICDWCDTWRYPNQFNGYKRKKMIKRLDRELAYFRQRDPNAKFVWVLQGFESAEANRKLPSYDQLLDQADVALSRDIDALFWYTWTFDPNEYQEVLGDHPELQPAIAEVAGIG